jgi:2-desacetyl-2-hydroxyethyl bacteriochlorophyllide A dehydrogenase
VLATGADVERFNEGDHVVVEGIRACALCAPCREGRTNLCDNYEELGFTIDGAAGPAVIAPAALTHRVDDAIPLEAAALIEPAAVVLRGLREVSPTPGSRVLVIGDGTVALLAAQLVRMWSPSKISVAGRRAAQASLATAVGVDSFTIEEPKGQCYDLVIEAAGGPVAVETALRAAAKSGEILLIGIAGHGVSANLLIDDFVNRDLTVRGSFSYTASAWAETVRLLNSGHFRPKSLITHRYPLKEYSAAFNALSVDSGEPRGKVLFEMR